MDESTSEGYLQLGPAARYCDVGESTLRAAATAGEVGTQRRKGSRWSFTREGLDRWMSGEKKPLAGASAAAGKR